VNRLNLKEIKTTPRKNNGKNEEPNLPHRIGKSNVRSTICKNDHMSKCEIKEDQSINRMRRANVRSATIHLQIGSREQMWNQRRSANRIRRVKVRS
jgi:hypothetical protein